MKQVQLVGSGENHTLFDELLGNYHAVAVGETSLTSSRLFKGQYAGLTVDEMKIPFIAYST